MEKTPQEISEEADRIIAMFDEAYFDYMNKILDRVRAEANNSHKSTPSSLGLTALEALGLPKIP